MTNEEAIQIAEERIYTSRYNAETLAWNRRADNG